MSQQSSLIKFEGKMDGISFYKRSGKYVARKASGPSKSRIMTDPRFQRTRENLSEFAGVAKATAAFIDIFAPVKNMRNSAFRGRMSKVMRSITKQSDGIRGERSILLSQHRELIRNIELNADLTFSSIVSTKFTTTQSAERTRATLNIPELNVNTAINAPQNATHFRLVQLVGAVSDMVYNTTLKAYEAVDARNNSISEVSSTDYLPVRGSQPAPVVLETALDDGIVLNDNVSVIQCIGIMFFEQIGPAYYPLTQGTAMKIVDVF